MAVLEGKPFTKAQLSANGDPGRIMVLSAVDISRG